MDRLNIFRTSVILDFEGSKQHIMFFGYINRTTNVSRARTSTNVANIANITHISHIANSFNVVILVICS